MAVMQTVNASNRSGYEALLRIYRETDLSQEKTRILSKSHIIFWSLMSVLVRSFHINFLFLFRFLGVLSGS